jgi:hypothetical protein
MKYNEYDIETVVWAYPGMAGWHFVTIPEDLSEDIKKQFGDLKRGWGSLPVRVTVGKTTWETSIFPDKKSKAYLLPVKADVRKKEKILIDNKIRLILEIKV